MFKEKLRGLPTVSVIIPVYNNKETLLKNLSKVLEANRYAKNRILETIVVDDASADNTAELTKKTFPEVHLIKHSTKRGFSAAANTGARAAKGKIITILSPEVYPDKKFLSHVSDYFKNPDVFAVSLHKDGETWVNALFKNGFLLTEKGEPDNIEHETFSVNPEGGIYRRDYWMRLGGMDEKVLDSFYWSATDLSYRALKRGLINIWSSRILIEEQTQVNEKDKAGIKKVNLIDKNYLLFHWKNITSPNLFRKHVLALFPKLAANPLNIFAVTMALRKVTSVFRARKKEVKEGKIADEAIFAKFRNT